MPAAAVPLPLFYPPPFPLLSLLPQVLASFGSAEQQGRDEQKHEQKHGTATGGKSATRGKRGMPAGKWRHASVWFNYHYPTAAANLKYDHLFNSVRPLQVDHGNFMIITHRKARGHGPRGTM